MRLFLIGGFLGSGKTTAIHQAINYYVHRHKRVGVITNDQGATLVDSGFLETPGVGQGEILNGCFCCRFDEFRQEIEKLITDHSPEYLFAEAVGSCTDLVATVVEPLIAQGFQPLIVFSVFADALLLSAIMEGNASFLNEEIRYIYRKQLEEADIIVVSKADLLDAEQRQLIVSVMEDDFPGKKILFHDSFNEADISAWLGLMEFAHTGSRASLDIDYELYARGELSLAWMDETILLTSNDGSAKTAAYALTQLIYKKIIGAGYPVGHLKFLVDDGFAKEKISYTTINRHSPVLPSVEDLSDQVSVLINARVQASHDQLDSAIREALKVLAEHFTGEIRIISSHHFQPGIPVPVWRHH